MSCNGCRPERCPRCGNRLQRVKGQPGMFGCSCGNKLYGTSKEESALVKFVKERTRLK